MTFNKCSINGKLYGYLYDDKNNEIEITEVILFIFKLGFMFSLSFIYLGYKTIRFFK